MSRSQVSGAGLNTASSPSVAAALQLVGLGPLMAATEGRPEIGIGLVDGPFAVGHPDLAAARILRRWDDAGACSRSRSAAPAAIEDLRSPASSPPAVARGAPAICPGCTLLVRPIFRERALPRVCRPPSPDDVGRAIVECLDAGARVVNLSASTGGPTTRRRGRPASPRSTTRLGAVRMVVAAAGNQAALGSSESRATRA